MNLKLINGFTLLELIIVIIIVGILAVLGLTQYTTVTEKGRSGEAKGMLGALRKAELAYYLENTAYATDITQLSVSAPTSCSPSHYFWYVYHAADCECNGKPSVRAARCTSGGKPPYGSVECGVWLCIESGAFNEVKCGMSQCP